ncbi:MurR/RpiR family transcriptional regulator [Niallia sp. 01092]|uniref:MurR/RpiR family transcriptional regulator n=1 Tax=unclassified Niallia TaxID=2837522 RepID=UPI003FD14503
MVRQMFTWKVEEMSTNQKKIADYIEKNINRIPYLTVQEIADELDISIASVSRFWKTCGYKNLKDFKQQLSEKLGITPFHKMSNFIKKVSDGDDLPTNMMKLGIQYLTETSEWLSREAFSESIQAILHASNTHIFAPGYSNSLGEMLRYRLRRNGLSIHLMETKNNEIFETLMHLTNMDLVIVFAFSNIASETKIIFDYAKKAGYQTILITDLLVSELIEDADIVLHTYRGQKWEYHSMVAPTILIESLIVGVGMENEQTSLAKLEHLNKLRKQYSSF